MCDRREREGLTRRELLHRGAVAGGALGFGPLLLSLGGCAAEGGEDGDGDAAGDTATDAPTDSPDGLADLVLPPSDVLLGLYPRSEQPDAVEAVRAACVHLDFSWLASGDRVAVKISSNSDHAHPAVTSPDAVRGVVAELLARGAGEVIVMEQAGIEHVRHLPDGRRYGSTREVLSGNGLLAAIEDSGASALFLDDLDFEEGFMAASPPEGSAWGPRMFLPKALEDVDHVVYLPRLGSHLIAGYTVGLKNGVGWLREDSRFVLHNDAAAFYQTTADINYVAPLRSRLRLVLTLADRALLHMGPDDGTVHELDPRVVLASSSLANHDALAVGLLTFFNATVALDPALPAAYSQDTAPFMNRLLVDGFIEQQTGLPWGETVQAEHDALIAHAFEAGVLSDRCLARAWELEGGRPTSIRVAMMGVAMIPALRAHLEAHGEGLFGFG